jgi:hypothetical protein
MASIKQIAIALRMSRAAGSAAAALRNYCATDQRDPVVERLLKGFASNQRSLHVPAGPATTDDPPILPALTNDALLRAQDAGWLTIHRSWRPR